MAGGVLNFEITEFFDIEANLLYTQRNRGYNSEGMPAPGGDVNIIRSYFEIPVLLKLGIPASEYAVPFIALGGSFNVIYRHTEENDTEELNLSDMIENKLGLLFSMGLGVKLAFGGNRLMIRITHDTEFGENENTYYYTLMLSYLM